jgi:hypothetical protein
MKDTFLTWVFTIAPYIGLAFLIWLGFQLLVGLNAGCCEPLPPDVGQL